MTIKKKIISFTVIGLFLAASFAFSGNGTGLINPVNMNSISEVLNAIANWLLNIGLILAPLMFVIGGIMFVTAYGNATKIQSAKKLMIYTGIGIIIVLLAKTLVEVLKKFIQ